MKTIMLSGLFISENYRLAVDELLTDFEQSLSPYEITISEMHDTINMFDGCYFE